MRLDHLLKPLRHSPRWLLCLALLLPLAQLAGAWHAYSHHGTQTSQRGHDGQEPQADHCAMCLTVADVNGGGWVPASFCVPDLSARHALPRQRAPAGVEARVALGYRSRAPPVTSI
jgi:hypothetical protein